MQRHKFANIFISLAWLVVGVSVVFLVFGFGEDGFRILRVSEFWIFINSLWLIAILFFVIGNYFNKNKH